MEKVTVGRMVHYVAYGTPKGEFPAGVCRAAVVTEIENQVVPSDHQPAVAVCVINPSGLFFNRGIPYDEAKAPGSWHWAERA